MGNPKNFTYLSCLMPLLTPSCISDQTDNLVVMDQIEASVLLPEGAHKLSDYGRYYTEYKTDIVIAIYLIQYEPITPDEGCETLESNLDTTECIQRNAEINSWYADELVAGERMWVENHDSIPAIDDGGCAQVTIEYDVRAKKFLSVKCNVSL